MSITHPTQQALSQQDLALLAKVALDEPLNVDEDDRLTMLLSRDGAAARCLEEYIQPLTVAPSSKTSYASSQAA